MDVFIAGGAWGPGSSAKRLPAGSRGYTFDIEASFFAEQTNAANPFGLLRQALDRRVTVAGREGNPCAARLREARDFHAFVEKAVPEVIEPYRAGRERKEAFHK